MYFYCLDRNFLILLVMIVVSIFGAMVTNSKCENFDDEKFFEITIIMVLCIQYT